MTKLKLYFLSLCCLVLVAFPFVSRADTIQLASTSGGNSGGYDVYPYNFSVNNSSTLTSLACLNFDREITFGEKWNVSIHGLSLDNSVTSINYRANAFLFSLFGTRYSNSDVQYAIWSIFTPGVTSNSNFTEISQKLVRQSMAAATDTNLIQSGFFNNFSLYTPTADQTGWTAGIPQEFIGTAVTPEPSSLLLLGTGMLSSGMALMRRRAAAKLASA